ncbi:MAG: trypsin-like serine protease [Myxococcota bacterium]
MGVLCVVACGDDSSPAVDAGADARVDVDAGRDAASSPDSAPPDECGEARVRPLVFFGTEEPTALPITPAQVLAIGSWGGCTGTFVTEDWVLTAAHCRIRAGATFRVGVDPSRPNVTFTAQEVRNHPTQDMTLVRMDAALSTRFPMAAPIPVNVEELTTARTGEIFEAAGYGRQEDGSSGEREFTAEPFVGFDRGEFLVIDGEGERGVCFGDSGGPVMLVASDGTVRVAGDLSFGDPSCVGRDRYSRTDIAVEWIEGFTGPTVADGTCGTLDESGQCFATTAIWCEGDELQQERCETCGWDATAGGFRCISGADPCEGLDGDGACDGAVARWCEDGVVRTRNCEACGLTCGDVGGYVDCREDPCMGIDFLGECDGDVARWCSEEGELRSRDCAARGGSCQFINDRIGFFCTR